MDGIMENQTCPTTGYQAATVCVPVTVTPFVNAGATVTKCCGEAVVVPGRQICSGIRTALVLSRFHRISALLCLWNSAQARLSGRRLSTALALRQAIYAPNATLRLST